MDDYGNVTDIDNINLPLRTISDIISDQIELNAIDFVKPSVDFINNK